MAQKVVRTTSQQRAHDLASANLEVVDGFCLAHTRERTDVPDNTVYRFSGTRYMRVDRLYPEQELTDQEILVHAEGVTTAVPLALVELAYVAEGPHGGRTLRLDCKGAPFASVLVDA